MGPTASGKSDLAVKIALRLGSRLRVTTAGQAERAEKKYGIKGAEIISADSRQVYRGLNIGSGKITKKEMRGVPHYLLDVASPKRTFTAAQYQKLGRAAIKKILSKGKTPVIAGGTGFYIDSLVYGYDLPKIKPNPALRRKLERKTEQELFIELKKLDPVRAEGIDRHNKRRLTRALEIIHATKKPVPGLLLRQARDRRSPYDLLKIGIKLPPEKLRERINKRLAERLDAGLVKEAERLHRNGVSWKKLDDLGLEYRYVSRYLRGLISREEMFETLKKESWKYAKRQMTWWRRDQEIRWVKNPAEALRLIKNDNSR